ncbi:MAG: trypsin-like peptidase domain-containing protein [Proteobacteria bacterium]|nr:trypsin-like peptidase domain-containing protein [Pseudomonadota bacterium]
MRRSHWFPAGLALLTLMVPPLCLASADLALPKDLPLPANVSVAIYLPKHVREFRSAFRSAGGFQTTDSVQLGNTFEESTLAAAEHFFKSSFMYEVNGTAAHGLLIAMHPSVKAEERQLVATAHYQVYDGSGTSVLQGDSVVRWAPGFSVPADVLGNLMQQVINRTLTDVVAQLRPTADKFPARETSSPTVDLLVDKDHPVASGTGFFLNSTGQVLTAAHVVHECGLLEVRYAGKTAPATLTANSAILDLAVLDTHVSGEHFLRLRGGGHPELGENVVNIGFPLQTLMTDAPTVTRGTLSSRAGLSGSVGQFQFSAPIQPGASGSPVIDPRGDVLGVAVGTLNAAELLKQGVLPQNVNFALEAFYVEKFLQGRAVAFSEDLADPHASGNVAIDDALPAVVGIKCYQ